MSRIAKGLKRVFTAELILLIAETGILFLTAVSGSENAAFVLGAAVAAVIAFLIELTGLGTAAGEEHGFLKALYAQFAAVACAIISAVLCGSLPDIAWLKLLDCFPSVCSLLSIFYVIETCGPALIKKERQLNVPVATVRAVCLAATVLQAVFLIAAVLTKLSIMEKLSQGCEVFRSLSYALYLNEAWQKL